MKFGDYIKILNENLQISEKNLDQNRWFIFQQNNDPKHMSKSATAWFQKKIRVLPLPSMNSDMNSIENLRHKLKVWINRWSPKNLQELEHITIEEWKEITDNTCSNLIKNFRKWLQQVIKMRDQAINY